MLKSKNKTIANQVGCVIFCNSKNKNDNKIVGADDPVRPNSKGITLIALIITIIVMLILVAVTINVALDTGLFGTAKKSAYQTEVSTIKEQLEIAKVVKVAENGGKTPTDFGITINDLGIEEKLKNKYGSKLVISEDGKLYYDSRIVTNEEEQGWLEEIGINKYTGEEITDLSILEDYFLGVDRKGKKLEDLVVSLAFPKDIEFKDDPNTAEDETELASNISCLNIGQKCHSEDEEEMYVINDYYIEYNNKSYALRTKQNVQTSIAETTTLEYKYAPKGKEGQDLGDVTGELKYKGWTILYDYGNGTVEAVSPEAMGSLTLGSSNLEESIESYNNIIETINNYCKDQITDDIATDENVRSVGAGIDPRPNLEGNNAYSVIPAEWPNDVAIKYNGKGKAGDTEYEQDFVRMSYYGVENGNEDYWIASRNVYALSDYIYFYMSSIMQGFYCGIYGAGWFVGSDGSTSGQSCSYAVRPIITVQIP